MYNKIKYYLNMKQYFILLLITSILSNAHAQTDIKNSKDHTLLDRLPDYSIVNYNESEFDSHVFFYDNTKHLLEGKKFTIDYRHNQWRDKNYKFPTRLQILRNYSNAVKTAGGRILFERYNSEHGYYSFKTNDGKEIWIQVKTSPTGNSYKLIIIEKENMRQDLVIDAELIKNTIELEGKIAIYGIYFDTGKSIIKEESQRALVQIAEYLENNPSINCWVVGHTDSDGSFQLNSKLSLDRATAIKEALQSKYNIPENRLFAEGVGPLAPIATNHTAEGRKLNRRVELVKK